MVKSLSNKFYHGIYLHTRCFALLLCKLFYDESMKVNLQILYPFETTYRYKNQIPFLCAHVSKQTFYLCKDKQITLVEPTNKKKKTRIIFSNYQIIDEHHLNRFNQTIKQIKGITYVPLYRQNNRYLCIGYFNQQIISLIIITIDLNTLGYYEIIQIEDIIKGEDFISSPEL